MQHIITDEEVERFRDFYRHTNGVEISAYKAALLDFLNNRPESTLGELRPIAEMPENPPEGYKRYGWNYAADFAPGVMSEDTHFIDIQLPTPDPEAEERQRFEEAIQSDEEFKDSHLEWKDGEYVCKAVRNAFAGWKLRSKLAKAK